MIVNPRQHNHSMRLSMLSHLRKFFSLLAEKIKGIHLMDSLKRSKIAVHSVSLSVKQNLFSSKQLMMLLSQLRLFLRCKKPSITCPQILKKVISSSSLRGVQVLICFMIMRIVRNNSLLQYMHQNKKCSKQEKKVRRIYEICILNGI